MKFLILDTTDPHLNLAIEEYLFTNTEDDIFMLWQNAPTVVIGKNQNAYAEIDTDFVKRNNVYIARRITGGGAVYHDLGNVNYTFISSSSDKKSLDFEYFTAPIIKALSSLGVCAELSGRNDLMTEGKKFSGNAQYCRNGRTLHHGTLLFDSDLDVLSNALKVDPQKISTKAIKSTRSRVTNLRPLINNDCDVQGFIELIAKHLIEIYSPTVIESPQSDEIDRLYRRNSSNEWLFPTLGISSSYSVLKKERYPFGIVEIYLDMSNELIKLAKIQGDFFGIRPVEELEALLSGCLISELKEKLSDVDIGDYIFGMNLQTLLKHINKA